MYPVAKIVLIILSVVAYVVLAVCPLFIIAIISDYNTPNLNNEAWQQSKLIAFVYLVCFLLSLVVLVYCDIARAVLNTARSTEKIAKLLEEQAKTRLNIENK